MDQCLIDNLTNRYDKTLSEYVEYVNSILEGSEVFTKTYDHPNRRVELEVVGRSYSTKSYIEYKYLQECRYDIIDRTFGFLYDDLKKIRKECYGGVV